ncbi:PspC domain-containing protein [Modestobacter sp. NPDC049651]|uniref:PspC domain-containing protein n=1 Tax=unclassified Modestobacter TaxID=2643866 RepID=UPI0033D4CDFE
MTSTPPPPPAPPAPEPPGGWAFSTPPPGPPPRPSLRRSRTDKVLSGVCGGLAEYTGVDALLWRVGAIALTLAGGSGILVYVLLWLLMPRATADPAVGAAGRAPARPAGPRSPVPGITLAVLLLVAGAAVLVVQLTDWEFGARGFFATALLVVGIGLAVAAVTGAGRAAKGGLIGLGVVLALAAAASTRVHVGGDGGVGDRRYVPMTAADVEPAYHGGVGDLTLDMGGIDLAGRTEPVVTRIDAGIGDVDVVVPPDADVRVRTDSGIGDVDLFDSDRDSGYFAGNGATPWSGDGTADIEITVHAGVGDVEVSRG